MEPLLGGEGSRMNMKKSRFMYYGASNLPEDLIQAIKDAGVKFVNRNFETKNNLGSCRL